MKLQPEILLQHGIPVPLWGINPRTVLGETWWNKTRRAAYRSTGYRCLACGVKPGRWIQAHEVYSIDYERGLMVYVQAVPLCQLCHLFIHRVRLLRLHQRGYVGQAEYRTVLEHGSRILRAARLVCCDPPLKMAHWSRWRMMVLGRTYGPRYKSYKDWLNRNKRGVRKDG